MSVHHRKYSGRWLLFWGALILLVTSGYECYGRLDMLIWTVRGVYNLCRHEGIDFVRAWTYFEPGMFELVAHLAACAALGLLGLALRNKPRAGYLFLLGAAAIVGWGWWKLSLYDYRSLVQLKNLNLIPLLMMALGAVINLVQFYRRKSPRAHDRETARPSRRDQAAS